MDLVEYGRAIVRGWWIVALCVLAGLAAGALTTAAATPIYQSSVKFFVVSPTAAGQSPLQARELSKGRIVAYASLVKSDKFVERLANNGSTGLSAAAITESISASADRDTLILSVLVSMPDQARAVQTARLIAGSLADWVGQLEAGQTDLNVVAGPTEELAPVSPRAPLNLALGGVLGLGSGIAIVVSRRLRDKTLRKTEEVEAAAGLPLLAVLTAQAGPAGTPAAPAAAAPAAPASRRGAAARRERAAFLREEAGRRLRTNIDHFRAMPASGVVSITSATAGEGKSSVALMLAQSWAEAGVSVLLVEGDLRNPKLAAELGLGGSLGLADVLAGRAALSKAIQHAEGPGLHVLAAGTVPDRPTELLTRPAAAAVLGQLRDTYSRVVIDAPAMQPFSDAALLAANADCTVLVLGRGRVTNEVLKSALRNLELVNAKLAGFVLTSFPRRRRRLAPGSWRGKASTQPAAVRGRTAAATPGVLADPPPDKRAVTRR